MNRNLFAASALSTGIRLARQCRRPRFTQRPTSQARELRVSRSQIACYWVQCVDECALVRRAEILAVLRRAGVAVTLLAARMVAPLPGRGIVMGDLPSRGRQTR